MISKKQYETLMKELIKGEYDLWAEGYLEDLISVHKKQTVDISFVLNTVKDFVSCRIIEGEEKDL